MWLLFPSALALTYTATDLGVLPGDSTSAGLALNDSGQVAGNSQTFLPHAFRHGASGLTGLGHLGGPEQSSTGEDIGADGTVVGSSASPAGLRAFVWTDAGGMSSLGSAGYAWSWAYGIDGDVVVGELSSDVPYGPHEGFVATSAGGLVPLTTLVGPQLAGSTARDVNAAGQIAGWHDHGAQWDAFRLEPSGVLTELGTLGGTLSEAYALNAAGAVTGTSTRADGTRGAFRYTDAAGLVELPDAGGSSEGHGIAPDGTVVGEAGPPGGGRPTAALWPASGGYVELSDLVAGGGWNLERASDINASGQITGKGFPGFAAHAFLLTPVPPALSMGPISPGVAGVANTVEVTGADPGASVVLVRGSGPGVVPVPWLCPALALDLRDPVLAAGPVVADATGRAVLGGVVPAGAAGATVHLQAFATTQCALSAPRSQAL